MIHRLGMILAIVLLAAAVLLPITTSADRDPPAVRPTPTVNANDGSNVVCVDLSTIHSASARSQESSNGLTGEGQVDPQAMEQFRQQLLNLLNQLDRLSDQLPTQSAGYRSDAKYALKQAREHIRQLTPQQLSLMQRAFRDAGADVNGLRSNLEVVETQVLAARRSAEIAPQAKAAPNSFPSVPTPTPNPGAIVHTKAAQDQINNETGDLFPPAWPTDVACPAKGYPTEVMFGMMVAVDVLKGVQIVLDTWCKEKTVTCPGSDPQDPIACWIAAGSKFILNVTEDVKEGFEYCNGNVTSAQIEALWHDTRIIHASLHEHDQNLITRTRNDNELLFDFRNLNLRLNIEANLASPNDNPEALFTLPRRFCISQQLERLTDPNSSDYDPFAPEAIAGCGLLEVVSDTVRSAIDMTRNAGQPINNAEAEFQAAVNHYNHQQWKLAYERFRKAYREAVGP